MTNIIALVLATAIPILFLYILYALDLYKTGSFRFILTSFIAGGLAFAAAYFINSNLYLRGYVSRDNLVRFAAPLIEEILKALILFYLVRRPHFTYFVDGAIYGFAAGIGFAVFENYQYILGPDNASSIVVALGRVLSTNLIHASASALVGVALGLSRLKRTGSALALMVIGLVVAFGLHSVFNNLVSRVSGSMILLYAALFGFGGAAFIAFMIKRGLAIEKVWIEEKLGMADRVTTQEAAVVNRLGDIAEILEPLEKRFGEEKAIQIENFLTIQARLGIKRKTLDLLTDPKMRKAVETEMADLRVQMDKARREVGSYAMLYLRNIFPPDASPLWGRLENVIQERAAARPKTGGMNLWANLDKRAAQAAGSSAGSSASKPAGLTASKPATAPATEPESGASAPEEEAAPQ